MRVLLLGSGAKDHAMVWWFSKSRYISGLYAAPGNLATSRIATNLPDTDPSDPEAVYRACLDHSIDFVFIGTEQPLFTGVASYLGERNIPVFGAPEKSLKLEGDRSFSRAFMARHNIPVPKGIFFDSEEPLERYLDRHEGTTFIIKSNLMTPSRIMLTSSNKDSLMAFARDLFRRGPVLLEQYIRGIPASCSLLIDDNGYLILPLTSDCTKKSKNDMTPTGGMGSVCPVPVLEDMMDIIRERIIDPTLYGLKVEKLAYKGVLTLSLMLDEATREPYLVDYHVRFSDPSAQAMIPLIDTDIIEILWAMAENRVDEIRLERSDLCSVAVVLASEGYPMDIRTGIEIKGITNVFLEHVGDSPIVFCGALRNEGGRAVTTGGRNITVVGLGKNLQIANQAAYSLIKGKAFEHLWYRDDIGNDYFITE